MASELLSRFRVGDWIVEPTNGLLVKDGEFRHLRPKSMDLLVLLASSPGKTVTKAEILNRLWTDTSVEDGGIALCVFELRAALGDDSRDPTYIKTRYRRGYQLIAAVHPLPKESLVADRAPSPRRRRNRRALVAIAAAGLLLAVTVLYALTDGRRAEMGESEAARPRAIVMDLTSHGDDRMDAWIGEAASHLLTAQLVATSGLRVVPREVASRFQRVHAGSAGDEPMATARRLRDHLAIDYVVTGHYMVSKQRPDGLQLDIAVTDSAKGEIVAAAVEVGEIDRLPEMVTAAAARLRASLGLSAAPDAAPSIETTRLPYSYFRAILHLKRFELEDARRLLETAVAEVPGAAWPHLMLAETWRLQGYDEKAARAVSKAVATADALRGEERLWFEGRAASIAERYEEAIARLEALVVLAPGNLEYQVALVSTLVAAGRMDAARTAIRQAHDTVVDAEGDPRLSLAKGRAALATGEHDVALSAASSARQRSRELGATGLEGHALYLEARALHAGGRVAEAEAILQAARDRFVMARDRPGEAAVDLTASAWSERRGDLDGAVAAARASFAISQAIGDRSGMAESLRLLGPQTWQLGDHVAGESALRKSLAITQEIGDRSGEAESLGKLGVSIARFSSEPARPYFEKTLAVYRELGHPEGIRKALMNLGRSSLLSGDFEGARAAYEEARTISRDMDHHDLALIAFNLGYAQQAQGQLQRARQSFRESAKVWLALGNLSMGAASLEGIGGTALLQGDLAPAAWWLRLSLSLRQHVGETYGLARTEVVFARALRALGQLDAATSLILAANERLESSSGAVWPAVIQGLAEVRLEAGQVEEASRAIDRLRAHVSAEHGLVTVNNASRRITEARVLVARGDFGEARELLDLLSRFLEERGAVVMLADVGLLALELDRARGRDVDRDALQAVETLIRDHGIGHYLSRLEALES